MRSGDALIARNARGVLRYARNDHMNDGAGSASELPVDVGRYEHRAALYDLASSVSIGD